MVWYSHLFKNVPQFVVIHTVEGFGIVNKAEIDGFLELSCFFLMIQRVLAIQPLVPLPSCSQTSKEATLPFWSCPDFINALH